MTECNQKVFSFASHFSRRVEAGFTAGQVSSEGGALLLRQADRKIGFPSRISSILRPGVGAYEQIEVAEFEIDALQAFEVADLEFRDHGCGLGGLRFPGNFPYCYAGFWSQCSLSRQLWERPVHP
jgi:hypothetical protein